MNAKSDGLRLFFHSPCFDGAVSAAIASDYFEQTLGFAPTTLIGVNYHLKDQWLSMQPTQPFAVVDFLYHPRVDFWVDHHPTTFLNEELRIDFEVRKGPHLIYDRTASSCALLLWENTICLNGIINNLAMIWTNGCELNQSLSPHEAEK
jgi:hypothetical protein